MIGADYSQAVTVLREMKRQGMDKPVIGGTPLISSAILNAAPEIPIVAPATFYATMKTPKAEKFVADVAADAAQDRRPAGRHRAEHV